MMKSGKVYSRREETHTGLQKLTEAVRELSQQVHSLRGDFEELRSLTEKLHDQQIGDLGFNKRQRDVIMKHVKKLEQELARQRGQK